MRSQKWILTSLLAIAVGMVPAALAGGFAAPTEGPVAFRRDKLPLDEDSIAGLSRQLEDVARGMSVDSAPKRRGVAQMLALAMALDPGNTRARQLVTEFKEGRHQAEPAGEQLEKSRARIWHLIGWLESVDAGSHGRLLADCLKDVMVVSDPRHPKSEALRADGERGAWKDWIPAPGAYEDAPAIVRNNNSDEPAEDSVASRVDPVPGVPLKEAQVTVMLWKNIGNEPSPNWIPAPAPLNMTAETRIGGVAGNQNNGFSVRIGADGQWNMFDKANKNIHRLLSNQHGKLPDVSVVITSKELGHSILSGRTQSVSAAAAVLSSAAVTGVAPDAIILGQIDETGAYRTASGFWNQVRNLGKGTGRRLVIPTEAAPLMSALLAMENPGFFMEYEVLAASDFTQLLSLSAKSPAEPPASAFAKFKEIRDRSAGLDLRQYIANRFIRQRLAEVMQVEPAHLSSKLLLIQAEGRRPTLVPRKVLAAELQSAIEPMAWLSQGQERDLDASQFSKLGATYEACRVAVDALSRHAEKADVPLVDQTRDLVVEIRDIDRASRAKGEYYHVQGLIRSARRTLIGHARDLGKLLAVESGDTPAQ